MRWSLPGPAASPVGIGLRVGIRVRGFRDRGRDMYIYIHTRIHTYIHTYTHAHVRSSLLIKRIFFENKIEIKNNPNNCSI
jgi:hypothetical protein